MIVSFSKSFVFVHIHKTGGSSMEIALDPHLSWNDLVLGSTKIGEAINKHFASRFGLNKHSTYSEIEKICSPLTDGMFKFALVREPVSRACSTYNFIGDVVERVLRDNDLDQEEVRSGYDQLCKTIWELNWSSVRAFIFSADFSEFIRSDRLAYDRAYLPQIDCLKTPDGASFITAYKIEEINEKLGEIEDRVGFEIELKSHNKSRLSLMKPGDAPSKDVEHLRTLYEEDYIKFGY